MLLCKCKTYRYCRTHPKCTAIHQTPAALCFPGTLPCFPGMDGSGAPWGRGALTPPVWKGQPHSKGAVKIIEPFGRNHLWPPWQAQLLDMVGWVFFSPPELPCNQVNPRGIEGSVPVGTGGFPLRTSSEPGWRAGCWHPTACTLLCVPCVPVEKGLLPRRVLQFCRGLGPVCLVQTCPEPWAKLWLWAGHLLGEP